MKHKLTYGLFLISLILSCEKPLTGFTIPPPSTSTETPAKPEPKPEPEPEPDPVSAGEGTIIVGYATSWESRLPDPELLTHINYAFGLIKSDFESLDIKNESRLRKIVALKNDNPELKVQLSIGGWGAGNFSEMAADEAHRKQFCQNCLNAVKKFNLDGIDLDWEYPTSSSAGISSSPADKQNFTLLVKDLRAVLGSDKLLTMASSSSAKYVNFKDFIEYMNFVNLMTYDMGDPPYHNAGLYKSGKTRRSCDESVTLHYQAGVPYDKIVLGMPFYGRDDEKTKPFTAGDDDNFVYYCDIAKGDYTECWDATAMVPYLTDAAGTMMLSYDNETSIGLKADYVKQKGLKGAMYWAIEGDDSNWTLSKAIAGRLIGWTDPNPPQQQEAFLATNPYVEKFLEEVNYPFTNNPDTDKEYSYSSVIGYPGGGPSENNIEIPPTYTITWTAAESSQKLRVWEGSWSRESALSGGVGSQDITNLVPGTTYNWQVTASSNAVVASGTFDTRGLLHQVYFTPNVRNGRDLGGYKGLGGKTVVYRKLYRGGRVDKSYMNSAGRREALADGILAELDLREASDVPSSSAFGSNIAFCAPGFESGYRTMLRDRAAGVKECFEFIVKCLRQNKPVYFHCAAGRDRTGTMAMILLGVLGVGEGDIGKDYELTYFCPAEWSMYKGEYAHKRTASGSYLHAIDYLWKTGAGSTFKQSVENYLLGIGVTQKDIDDLRTIMLE
jgi:chitinase